VPFALVDTKTFEAIEEAVCELRCSILLVAQDDHSDAPRLPVANRLEHGSSGLPCCLPHDRGDPFEVGRRAPSQEGNGDVEVVSRHDPEVGAAAQLAFLPLHEAGDRFVREEQGDEEP
jgi:hypothetical protein